MSILNQLLEDLARAPEDWRLRGVIADWFEDNHRPEEAECLRWMFRHQKRPHSGSADRASWFNEATISEGLGDPASDIPGPVFVQLIGGREVANHKSFDGMLQAEAAFRAAWVRARAGGWSPDAC